MRYFLDTEFVERPGNIDLISIGIVDANGATFYAENRHCNVTHFDDWHMEHVYPNLKFIPQHEGGTLQMDHTPVIWPGMSGKNIAMYGSMGQIKEELLRWIGTNVLSKPRFYSYYADYDWVVFCWIFGRMVDLPKGFPMYCVDLKQMLDGMGNPKFPNYLRPDEGKGHDALEDAKFHKRLYEWIKEKSI
jgi:hypothetical protein